ncbi:hypothetical protein GVAV_002841 [Gurleya vavrai]
MSIQYFTTSFYNESPNTLFKTQISNPTGLFLLRIEDSDLKFLIEPSHDHTLSNNLIRLGSGFRKLYKINTNTSVKLKNYNKTIKDAKIVVLSCNLENFKNIKEIKYIYTGFKIENANIEEIICYDKDYFEEEKNNFYRITNETRFYIKNDSAKLKGFTNQQKSIEKKFYSHLFYNDLLNSYNLSSNNFFILTGEKGNFLVEIINNLADEMYVNSYICDFLDYNDKPDNFSKIVKKYIENKPSIIILKNYDPKNFVFYKAIAPLNEKSPFKYGNIFIFVSSCSERAEAIQKLFEINNLIYINNPDLQERVQIVKNILEFIPTNFNNEEIKEISENMIGMSYEEIKKSFENFVFDKIFENANKKSQENKTKNNLCEEKYFEDLIQSEINEKSESSENICNLLKKCNVKENDKNFIFNFNDFNNTIKTKITNIENESLEKPKTKFSDIGGYEKTKQILRESVIWPLTYKKIYNRLGLGIPKGIILHGPPGCAKTLLAKAISNESKMSFISVKGSELESKYVGDTARQIKELFKKARQNSPCIIFIDEIDAIVHKTDGEKMHYKKTVTAFLTEMDGLDELKDVIVIGTTNKINYIDKAFLRPGRIDKCIEVGLPDEDAREQIFRLKLKREKICKELIDLSKGLSGAEITFICQEAAMFVVRKIIEGDKNEEITDEILLEVLSKIKENL